MLAKFLVFMSAVGMVKSGKCYKYETALHSEFISATPTCDGEFCVSVIVHEYAFHGCVADDCSQETIAQSKNELMRTMMSTVHFNNKHWLKEMSVKCCKGDLCIQPTAVAPRFPIQCHDFIGKKSELKGKLTKCNYGKTCVTATSGEYVATGCYHMCTFQTRMAAKTKIWNHVATPPNSELLKVRVECCTENFCDSKFLSADGAAEQDLTKVKETTDRPAPTAAPTAAPNAAPSGAPNAAPSAAPGKDLTEGSNGRVDEYGAETGDTANTQSQGNVGSSLSSLLPFTLGLLAIVYSMQ